MSGEQSSRGQGWRQRRLLLAGACAFFGIPLVAQRANLVKPRMAGAVIASQYQWQAAAQGNGQAGVQTVTVNPGSFTLRDGTAWMPLRVGTTIQVSGDANSEVITPTVVNCSVQSGICTLTANFAYPHERMTLSSATDGLQEAVNAAGAGGWIIDDIPLAKIAAPLVLTQTVRLTGFSAFDNATGTQIEQATANTDTIQIGTASTTANGVVLEHLLVEGVVGNGADAGVAIHCVNCVHTAIEGVVAKQAHDGLFFDSANGHAYDAAVSDSHFIDDYYGVHIAGGAANRLTFTGDTVDGNVYGVFDDGGWVHTWVGNDIEANSAYGYWQQVSQPGNYSGRNVDFIGNYFEANGTAAGQGDLFLGQLVDGGTGNNGSGCSQCEINGNIFNAANGGPDSVVTAINFGAVTAVVSANDYSGYATGKRYAYITGPNPNFSYVLSLGDGGASPSGGANTEGFGGAAAGDLTRIDPNSSLVLGGTDRLTDQFGTALNNTVIESPTGRIALRGKPGGAMASNGVDLHLEGNSTANRSNQITFANQGTDEWGIKNDVAGANAHDFCLANDYANPSAATCDLYINQQKHFLFRGAGIPGNITLYGDYNFNQQANGDPALVINRFTDTSPSGYLLDIEDKTNSTPLFRIDTAGTVVAGNWSNGNSSFSIGALTAASGTFSGNVSAASYGAVNGTSGSFSGLLTAASASLGATALGGTSTVGGKQINTDPAVVNGQSGTWWSGTYAAGGCITGGISFGSGVAIGMAVASNPETSPPAGLVWNAVIDAANHVTVRVCNITSSSIVWSSGSVWDVRVMP